MERRAFRMSGFLVLGLLVLVAAGYGGLAWRFPASGMTPADPR